MNAPPWDQLRGYLLFGAGLFGVLYETIINGGAERPALLLLFGGMMGLPFIRFADKQGNGNGTKA